MTKIWRIAGVMLAMALTIDEAFMVARVAYAEANAESDYGKRLVIDCVLNRVEDERFPGSVFDVVGQKDQFASCDHDPTVNEILMVFQEAEQRTNDKVLWFRTKKYHSFGKPIIKEGNHYFSGKE